MKDEENYHGAVDKSFSEQWNRIVDADYILCEKNWTRTRSGTGAYGKQVLGRWQMKYKWIWKFYKDHCTSKDLTFCFA